MAPYRNEAAIEAETWPEPVREIEPEMRLAGLHHISTIASSLERTDAFYGALGLSLVRKTIDHDDSEVQHWYWGLDGGRPGTVVAAFPIVHPAEGGKAIYGRVGAGVPHHVTFAVEGTPESWEGTLEARGIAAARGPEGTAESSIAIRDPDGLLLELTAASATGLADAPPHVEPAKERT